MVLESGDGYSLWAVRVFCGAGHVLMIWHWHHKCDHFVKIHQAELFGFVLSFVYMVGLYKLQMNIPFNPAVLCLGIKLQIHFQVCEVKCVQGYPLQSFFTTKYWKHTNSHLLG